MPRCLSKSEANSRDHSMHSSSPCTIGSQESESSFFFPMQANCLHRSFSVQSITGPTLGKVSNSTGSLPSSTPPPISVAFCSDSKYGQIDTRIAERVCAKHTHLLMTGCQRGTFGAYSRMRAWHSLQCIQRVQCCAFHPSRIAHATSWNNRSADRHRPVTRSVHAMRQRTAAFLPENCRRCACFICSQQAKQCER